MSTRSRNGITRRTALKLLGTGASALWLPGFAVDKAPSDALAGIAPVDRTLPEVAPRRYSGDAPARAHEALWDKRAFIRSRGGAPQAGERVPLAIVGGGLSGLTSAYRLRAHRPVILEQAPRFGGNARAESWNGIDYAIGSAYFVKPDPGSDIDNLVRELRLADVMRERTAEGPVVWNGKRHYEFWKAETDPGRGAQFERLGAHFHDVLNERNGWFYPDIPVMDSKLRPRIDALDRSSFLQHLERVAGGPLHAHIATAIEHFCSPSFGASAREVSAAAGLNFYAAEFDTLMVCAGGNAAVAEALLRGIAATVPASHLRAASMALDVSVRDDGAVVTYANEKGELRSLLARAVILACPKFVAAKLVDGLEDARRAAIARLRYNAYLVANVMLEGHVRDDFYDLFLLGDGTLPGGRAAGGGAARGDRRRAGELRAAPAGSNGADPLSGPALPRRPLLLADESHARYRAEFEEQILREILPLVGRAPSDIVDIRVARWGHPLPVAQAGLIADGVPETLRQPYRDRVFFVEQDNWALPAFETAVTEALTFAPQVERLL
jgi:hypothetical protein